MCSVIYRPPFQVARSSGLIPCLFQRISARRQSFASPKRPSFASATRLVSSTPAFCSASRLDNIHGSLRPSCSFALAFSSSFRVHASVFLQGFSANGASDRTVSQDGWGFKGGWLFTLNSLPSPPV